MRLHSSPAIFLSATKTSWLEKKEDRGSESAMATRRTRIGVSLGGSGQRSCPYAGLLINAKQVATRIIRAADRFFIQRNYAPLAGARASPFSIVCNQSFF